MTMYLKRMIRIALAAFVMCGMLCACGNPSIESTELSEMTKPVAGEVSQECTWEAFQRMSAEEQMAFQNSFSSYEAFDAWLQAVQPEQTELPEQASMPWDNGGKQPEAYTMEEFDALTAEQQIAFQNSFEEWDGFDKWLERVGSESLELPWDNGGKQPEDYTWEEFEALSAELQIAFQESYESFDAFDAWMQKATCEEAISFTESHGKHLEDYTWEEFEKMSGEEQMRFQNSFDSFEAFDQWLQSAQAAAGIVPE